MKNKMIVENYLLSKELKSDSIGINFRAVEIADTQGNRPASHKLVTKVHPHLFSTPEVWNNAEILFQRIRESGLSNLYTPEEVIKGKDSLLLVYPFINGRGFEKILADSSVKEKPAPFNLAFTIAVVIATLLEEASSIVVRGENTFHGFLTPDNIILDQQGNIFLKYFGLWPYCDENDRAISETIRSYGPWLPPEFLRREQIDGRADYYHLGYLVYRMLTGNYFSYLPGEDFETTFTSIGFASELPSTDIEFLTHLIEFFKKTLNPDPHKRFETIQDFKDYILVYFLDEKLPDVQAQLTAYLQDLYGSALPVDEAVLEEELSRPLAEIPPAEPEPGQDIIIETVTGNLTEKKRAGWPVFAVIIFVLAAIGATGYFIISNESRQAEKERIKAEQLLKEQDKERRQIEKRLQEVNEKLKKLETQKPQDPPLPPPETSKVEKTPVRAQKKSSPGKKQRVAGKSAPAAVKKQSPKKQPPKEQPPVIKDIETPAKKTSPTEPQPAVTPKPRPNGKPAVEPIRPEKVIPPKSGPVPLKEVTQKPKRLSAPVLQFPSALQKAYAGRRATVRATILVDETGAVIAVNISTKLPPDLKSHIAANFKTWKYKPALLENKPVPVKLPVKIKIHIKPEL